MATKYLVTGGCGFIGSHFIDKIRRTDCDAQIMNIDNLQSGGAVQRVKKEKYDLKVLDLGKKTTHDEILSFKPDFLINFAAETHVDRSLYQGAEFINSNVTAVYNLCETLKTLKQQGNPPKFIHISTDEVYGPTSNMVDENTNFNPSSFYSATKVSSEAIINSYFVTYGIQSIILRPSNAYGPGQFHEKLIPNAINNWIKNEWFLVYDDGRATREYTHVRDLCDAIWKVMYGVSSERIFNVSSNDSRSILEVLSVIEKSMINNKLISMFKKEFKYNIRPGHDQSYSISSERIKKEFLWPMRRVNFEEGIEEIVKNHIKGNHE